MFTKIIARVPSIALSFFCLLTFQITAQEAQVDAEGFEIFSYEDGDTTYLMKKYYIAFLKSGDKKSDSEDERMRLQQAHLEHMSELAGKNKICIAGPFGDDGIIRGIVIYNAKTMEEAQSYAESDPSVMAGVLKVEIHPWWAAKGSKLF